MPGKTAKMILIMNLKIDVNHLINFFRKLNTHIK